MDAQTVSYAKTVTRAGSYPYFDWLRLILASVVVIDHAGLHLGIAGLAVQTFFALSGWLIGAILLKTEKRELPRFYFNRATRIWLPYLAAVAALYILAAAREGFTPGFFHYLLHDLTFTHNWFVDFPVEAKHMPLAGTGGHFWSISVEEQFYLAAPLLMVALPGGKKLSAWATLTVLALATAWWSGAYLSIILGVLAAVLHQEFGDWHLHRLARSVLCLSATASIMVIIAGGFLVGGTYNLLAPIFGISVVLLTAAEGQRGTVGMLAGGISYPLYLNHWTGIFLANFVSKHAGLPLLPTVLLAWAAAVAAATVAYELIDKRVPRIRRRYYSPRAGKALMLAAYLLCATGTLAGLEFSRPS